MKINLGLSLFLATLAAACSGSGTLSPTSPTGALPGGTLSLEGDSAAVADAIPEVGAASSGPRAIGPALSAQNCSQERSLRSIDYVVATRVEFINETATPKRLYWLDYTGQRIRYGTVVRGEAWLQPTYVTHPWVVTDETDTCVAIFAPTAAPGTATIRDATPPLTAAAIANSLGEELNRSFIAAMSDTTPAQATARIVASCSRGGTIRVQHLGPAPGGGRVTLSNTPVLVSGCAHSLNGRTVTAHGTLMANGFWTASEPASPVRLAGDLGVDELGPITIDGTTGVTFLGAVGGISVGAPDTAPPPNPIPVPCTVNGVPVQCPDPAPTGSNVTGTWVIPGQPGGLVLSQPSGSTAITGTALVPSTPLPPGTTITIGTNSVTGTIVGNTVNLVHLQVGVVRTVTEGIIITATGTSTTRYSMQTTGSTMSGTAALTVTTTTTCSGSEFCPPGSTTTNTSSQSLTLTRQ